MILTTPRLTLRPQAADDAAALFTILSDADAMRFWNRPPLTRLAVAEDLIADQLAAAEAGVCRYWTVLEQGQAIGSIDLSLIANRSAELGFLLRRDRWGVGLASEAAAAVAGFAFGPGGLARLAAAVHAGNHAARRVLEKTGFALVETRPARQADGRSVTAAFYLMTQSQG